MTTAYRYKGKLYPRQAIDRMSTIDSIRVNTRLAELGLGCRWNDLMVILSGMPMDTAEDRVRVEYSQEGQIIASIAVWVSLRLGGLADFTLDDALELPLSEVELVELTEDHKESAPKARARKGSAQAGASTRAARG